MSNQIIKILIECKDGSTIDKIHGKESLIFDKEEHIQIFEAIRNYYIRFNKIPEYSFLKEQFDADRLDNLTDELTEIQKEKTLIDNSAEPVVQHRLNEYAKKAAQTLISKTKNNLKTSGQTNIKDEVEEIARELHQIAAACSLKETSRGVLSGQSSIDRFKHRYHRAKIQDSHYMGKFGIDKIDNVVGGFAKNDMINIAGFTNQGKSPLLRKIAYNALCQTLNVVFIPLETSREDTENFFYVLHANNVERFGKKIPKITNAKVRNGTLNKKEEDFLYSVVEDFNMAEDMGNLSILQPEDSDYSMDNLMSDLIDIHNSDIPIDVVVLDYIGLLKPTKNARYVDATMINQMHSRMRKEMLAFDGGKGFTYIGACQMNRKGYREMLADKEHLYDLTAIGDYNAIERDSTLLFSIARTPEDENAGIARIQCLKSRDNKKFSPFTIMFDGAAGNFLNDEVELDIDEALEQLSEMDIY